MGARDQRRARRHVQPAPPEFSESDEGGIPNRRRYDEDSSTDEEVEQWILGEPRFAAQPRYFHHNPPKSSSSSPYTHYKKPHHHDQHSNPISGSPHTHTVDHIPTKPMTSILCTNSRRPSQFHNNHTRETHKNPNHQSSNIHDIQTDSSQNHCKQSRFALTHENQTEITNTHTHFSRETHSHTHSHSPNQFSTLDTKSTKTPLFGDQPIDPTPLFENAPENQFEINKTQEESKAERLMCTFSLEEEELLNSIDQLQQLGDESMAAETQEISVELSTIDVYHYDSALHVFNSMPRRSSVSYNAMMSGYLRNGDFDLAREVFDKMPERDLVSWNVMISGYLRNRNLSEARELFESMPKRAVNTFVELWRQGIEPNEFTFSNFIKGCANQAALDQGIQLAAQVIRFNFDRNPFVSSILVDMYGKCGLLDDSIRLFDDIDNPTEYAWNSWISVFAQHGLGKEALETLDRMIHRGVKPNAITFVSLLTGCSHAGLIDEGLTHFYSMEKTYGLVLREEFIKNMPFEPNAFGWCSFLGACRIHGDKERRKIVAEKLMQLEPENSGAHVLLSNIYAKEQQWKDVKKIKSFEAMTCRNVGSWNTLITGYAQSSEITLARNLFDRSPLYTIACDSVHFVVPVNDKIVLSVLIGQIVGTLGFGFKNVKTKGVRRRQWQIAWAFLACRWTIVLVPLWLWVALRRDFSIGVYHSHKPDMGLRSFIVQLVHFRMLNRTRGRVLFEEGVTDVGVIFYVGLGLILSFILGLILCL